jgi:hypothetical protein
LEIKNILLKHRCSRVHGAYGSVKADIHLMKESSLELCRVDALDVRRSEKVQRFMECIKKNNMALRILGSELASRFEGAYQYGLDDAIRNVFLPIEDDQVLRWHLRHPGLGCKKPQLLFMVIKAVRN